VRSISVSSYCSSKPNRLRFFHARKGLLNKKVADTLREIALFLELKGENPFKVKAIPMQARRIDLLEEDLSKILKREGLGISRESEKPWPSNHRTDSNGQT